MKFETQDHVDTLKFLKLVGRLFLVPSTCFTIKTNYWCSITKFRNAYKYIYRIIKIQNVYLPYFAKLVHISTILFHTMLDLLPSFTFKTILGLVNRYPKSSIWLAPFTLLIFTAPSIFLLKVVFFLTWVQISIKRKSIEVYRKFGVLISFAQNSVTSAACIQVNVFFQCYFYKFFSFKTYFKMVLRSIHNWLKDNLYRSKPQTVLFFSCSKRKCGISHFFIKRTNLSAFSSRSSTEINLNF